MKEVGLMDTGVNATGRLSNKEQNMSSDTIQRQQSGFVICGESRPLARSAADHLMISPDKPR